MLVTQKRLRYELPDVRSTLYRGQYVTVVDNLLDRWVVAFIIGNRLLNYTRMPMVDTFLHDPLPNLTPDDGMIINQEFILSQYYNKQKTPEYQYYISRVFPLILQIRDAFTVVPQHTGRVDIVSLVKWLGGGRYPKTIGKTSIKTLDTQDIHCTMMRVNEATYIPFAFAVIPEDNMYMRYNI